jgi:hypothetical protein
MKNDFTLILRAISEVNDNIWLGDLKKAIDVADKNIVMSKDIAGHPVEISKKTRQILKEKRRQAQNVDMENGRNRRLWVAGQVAKSIKEQNIDMRLSICGVLLNQLSDLRDSLRYLINAKSQIKLDELKEENLKNKIEMIEREGYRYSIQRYSNRWDIRTLLDESYSHIDSVKLREQLSSYDFSVFQRYKEKLPVNLELFSRDMYVQVIFQDTHVSMNIFAVENLETKEKIDVILKAIVNAVAKTSNS